MGLPKLMEGLRGALRGSTGLGRPARSGNSRSVFADKSILINRKLSPATITARRNARTIIRMRSRANATAVGSCSASAIVRLFYNVFLRLRIA